MRIPPGLETWGRTVTLPHSGEQLFCYDAGPRDAPGMLLVHGLGDEADTWRRVIPSLAERHRVVAPDLPGFGRSLLPGHGRLTPPYLAALLRELALSLGMSQVTLVGSSLGAAFSQVIALSDPGLVSRLFLVDGGLLAMNRISLGILLVLVPGVGEKRYRSLADNIDAAYASLIPYYASLGNLPAEERAFLRERVGERVASLTQRRAYFASFRGFIRWMLVRGRRSTRMACRLDIPTTYVWGRQDHIIPVRVGEEAQARHPGSRLSIIPSAGHLPHQEAPQEFLRVIGSSP